MRQSLSNTKKILIFPISDLATPPLMDLTIPQILFNIHAIYLLEEKTALPVGGNTVLTAPISLL